MDRKRLARDGIPGRRPYLYKYLHTLPEFLVNTVKSTIAVQFQVAIGGARNGWRVYLYNGGRYRFRLKVMSRKPSNLRVSLFVGELIRRFRMRLFAVGLISTAAACAASTG